MSNAEPLNGPLTLPCMFVVLQEELASIAKRFMGRERHDHTLQPTALVHEAYLRLREQDRVRFESRDEFLAIASVTIRRILVNHAKARMTQKRGGSYQRLPFVDDLSVTQGLDFDLLALDEALHRLAALNPRQGRIVELLFFGGLKIPTVAQLIGVSPRTVAGDWAMARYWLYLQFQKSESE